MKKIRVYLDNCCFNRPFDDQTQDKIILETEAKIKIQNMIKNDILELVWSYILDYENSENPFEMKRYFISEWKKLCIIDIEESEAIIDCAEKIRQYGIDNKDALHIACAIAGKAEYFFTTDRSLLKKKMKIQEIIVWNPVQFFIDFEIGKEKP